MSVPAQNPFLCPRWRRKPIIFSLSSSLIFVCLRPPRFLPLIRRRVHTKKQADFLAKGFGYGNRTEATDKDVLWVQKSNGPPQSQQPLICSAIIHFRCGDFATYHPQARRKSIFLQQGLFRKLFLQRNSPLIKIACSNLHFFIFFIFMGMQHLSLGFVSFHVQIFC